MTQKRMYIAVAVSVVCTILACFTYFHYSQPTAAVPAIKSSSVPVDFINMTEEMFRSQKEREIVNMIADTAEAYGLNPYVLSGLAYHESDRFREAHKKRKDSNNRFSYGLFQIQLETAKGYEKEASDSSLLTPSYNTHMAALILKKNLEKYGSYDFALAAHNAGTVRNNTITNMPFVQKVHAAMGELIIKYPSLWKNQQ